MRSATTSIMPNDSKSSAPPISCGKTRTGRPQCPYATTVPAAPIAGDQRSTVRRLIGDPSWTKWATSTGSTCARQFSGAPLASCGKHGTRLPGCRSSRCTFRPGLAKGLCIPLRSMFQRSIYKTEYSKHRLSRLVLREFTQHAFLQDGYPTRRVAGPGLRSVLDMAGVALVAGSVSTVLFAVSTLPMLIKAARTKELNSYSRGNLVLANVGNAVHSIYVLQLPAGPIWALHSFYVVTSALMLIWHLRYASRAPRSDGAPSSTGGFHDDRTRRDGNHRSRSSRPSHGVPPAAARTFLPDSGQQRQSRRQLARPMGVPAPLLPCTVRRPAGPAVPQSAMVLSHQGRGRRLPVGIRQTVQTPGAHPQQSRPAARRGWEVRAAARG